MFTFRKDKKLMSIQKILEKSMKKYYLLSLIVSVLIFSPNKDIIAGNWKEHFNKNLDSWTKRELQRERVTWQVKDGRLNVYTKPFCNGILNIAGRLPLKTHYTLAFTAIPIETNNLRVKMKIVNSKNANVGIFIGEYPEDIFVNPLRRTYQFVDYTIGGPLDFRNQNPQIELELNKIDIGFARGLFTLYANGKKIVDFQDGNFRRISYLGIVAFPKNCSIDATVVLDDFIISGPSIPSNDIQDVLPRGKAAEMWGSLKGQ